MQVTDVAGNVALTKMHVTLNNFPVPVSLLITPASLNLTTGGTQEFTATDDQGRPRPDATWTVSNSSLATITTDSSPWLTALAVGSVTVTATAQGVSAQAQVAILSGTLTPGTANWTVAPLPNLKTERLLQAIPSMSLSPDLYDLEAQGDGSNPILRAMTIDGQQLWKAAGTFSQLVPDGFGGIIGVTNTGLTDLDSQTGAPVWSYTTQNPLTAFAVRFDGAIIATESDVQNNNVLLDVFDGNTGQRTASIPVPQSQNASHEVFNCPNPVIFDASAPAQSTVSPVFIDSTGNAYVEYGTFNRIDSLNHSTCNQLPMVGTELGSEAVGLLEVAPDGSSSLQAVTTSNWSTVDTTDFSGVSTVQDSGSFAIASIAIPDGQGGTLASWTQEPNVPGVVGQPNPSTAMISHMSSNGEISYQLPVTNSPFELVLGDNGTAFASNSTSIVSFDVISGSTHWSYGATAQNTLSLLVSVSGGGVSAKTTSPTNVDTVLRFDSSGTVTSDGWTASGINNYGGTLWLGYNSLGPVSYYASPVKLSTSTWYAPDGNGGNAATPTYSVSNFSQQGPNQATLVGVVQEIFDALPLTTFPGTTSCQSWLNAGTRSIATLQTFLPSDWAHGNVNVNGNLDYENGAITDPGDPGAPATTVNDHGFFFNTHYPAGNSQVITYKIGPRGYPGNDFLTQASIALHELGHQAELPITPPEYWQQNDASSPNPAVNNKAVMNNDKQVDNNCGTMIRALPSVNMPSDLPPGLSAGLSPATGGAGTTVTINGTNFGTSQGGSSVAFAGASGPVAAAVSSWSRTQIRVTVPVGAVTGNVVVTVSGIPATGPIFTMQ